MSLKGIDVSSWSHPEDKPIDWKEVRKAGARFVMVKVSQSTDYVSPFKSEDAIEAHAHGLLVGLYHYAVPHKGDAVAQGRFAAAQAVGLPLSLGIALDLEENGELQIFELAQWATDFMRTINEHGHHAPLYVDGYYLGQMPGAPFGHVLWFASTVLPETYHGPAPWMRQTAENVDYHGVPGLVDLDELVSVRGQNAPGPSATAAVSAPPESVAAAESPAGPDAHAVAPAAATDTSALHPLIPATIETAGTGELQS
jgi:GH25 family lysozyme M1 (1,4-beta-N-acetylmuramidase)